MTLAERLGMTLNECLNRVTFREYQTWQEHFANELNIPSRSDYYLMQIASEVFRGYIKDKRSPPPLSKFKVTFSKKGEKPKVKLTPEQIERKSQIARAMVEARLSMQRRKNKTE